MDSIDKSNLSLETVENELVYKRIEIPVKGRKVNAHFPNVDADSKIMTLVQEVLISSYLNNINGKNKNVSFVEKT